MLKKSGKIIVDAFGRYRAAMREFGRNPEVALKLTKFKLNYACDKHGDWGRVFSPEELKGLFERNSIKVIGIHGRFMDFIPKEIQEAKE